MACKAYQADNQSVFASEIAIHFPGGMGSLDKGQLLVFVQLIVCLTCGFTEFSVPKAELRRLAEGVENKEY